MKVLVVGNFSDTHCGYTNICEQTEIALRRAGHDVTAFDGTYSKVYARREAGLNPFFPDDAASYDIVHVIYSSMTLNHYAGADWTGLRTSWLDGGPSDAYCPFEAAMQIRWSDYPREGFHYLWYPVPDWITDLPLPTTEFSVGMSSIRGDGVSHVQQLCKKYGWTFNGPTGLWLSVDDEIRRLARSSVNVCWYHTAPHWRNSASAPSMLLASGRPILINHDHMVSHLQEAFDVYCSEDLEEALVGLIESWRQGLLIYPRETRQRLSWTAAVKELERVWRQ